MLRESGLFLAPEISHLADPWRLNAFYASEKFETEKVILKVVRILTALCSFSITPDDLKSILNLMSNWTQFAPHLLSALRKVFKIRAGTLSDVDNLNMVTEMLVTFQCKDSIINIVKLSPK